jgi:hypothetical protein
MLEKEIEQKVVTYAKSKNFLAYKFTSPSNRSVPDRLFISPTGGLFFIEFKRKGKIPTKLQESTFKMLTGRGISVEVIDDYEAGKILIDEHTSRSTSLST